MKAETICCYC